MSFKGKEMPGRVIPVPEHADEIYYVIDSGTLKAIFRSPLKSREYRSGGG
jgi:hypothetical protein